MPRRDVVLTGLIAFGAGVAVGANWPKLRKKIGPLLEKLGLQMADLGDFLSASGMEESAAKTMETKARRPRARQAKAAKTKASFVPPTTRRGSKQTEFSPLRPLPKRKILRRKPVIAREPETPLATGTFGH